MYAVEALEFGSIGDGDGDGEGEDGSSKTSEDIAMALVVLLAFVVLVDPDMVRFR
jgi:hypothetical protein